ncbi:glycosyltransferase [Bacterioplanoides sp.]|uniref:glycosyltransferase n=1 Tax=Bacterioplanoides sp. TaxID=2066072 RepID=UPI003B001568
MSKLCTVIMVNYGTPYHMVSALSSAIKVNELKGVDDFRFVVIDNASPDNSEEILSSYCKLYDNVEFIKFDKNLGFAGAHNRMSDAIDSEYLLLLNPDTYMMNPAINKLISFSKLYPENGIWGGVTFFPDGNINSAHAFKFVNLWGVFCRAFYISAIFPNNSFCNPDNYASWDRKSVKEVDVVQGSFLLMKTDTWNDLNGFDLDFFMYGEETDLCYRAKEIGCSPVVDPESKIVHLGGVSEKVRSDKIIRLFEARCLFLWKNKSRLYFFMGVLLHLSWALNRGVIYLLLSLYRRSYFNEGKSWFKVIYNVKDWAWKRR